MKKFSFLILALVLASCSSRNVVKERQDILEEKEKVTKEILKENNELTLEKAIKISLDRNLDLKTKEIESEISHLDKLIAFGNFLPHINLAYTRTVLEEPLKARAVDTNLDEIPKNIIDKTGAKFPAFKPEIAAGVNAIAQGMASVMPSSLETRIMDKDFHTITLNAELPIFVPSTWFLYNARSKGEDISRLTKELTEKMIKLQTIGQYYYILALESENKYLLEEVRATEKLKDNANIAYQTGSILEWEAQKADVLNKIKKHSLEKNERDLSLAKIKLLNTMDLYPFANFDLKVPKDEEYTNITLDEAIYEALKNSNLIEIREGVIGVKEDVTRIAISNFLPKIILTGSFVNTNTQTLVNNNFLMGTIGGLFSVFNGFQNVNEYRKARREEKIAYIKREQEITKVIVETTNAYNEYKNSYDDMQIASNNFLATKGMLHQKRLEKETGYIDEQTYIQALSEYEKALTLKEKAKFKYRVSRAVLDMLMEKSIFTDEKGEKNEKK